MLPSRRAFFGRAAALAGAARGAAALAQGLDQFGASAPPCTPDQKVTPAVPADATYRPGSPRRTSLTEPGVTGKKLTLQGTVSGVTCGRIKGADVDFWQADQRGEDDTRGFLLRGRQLTDDQGRYHLLTIVPGAAAGRAPHIGVHVRVMGKADFWTEIFFPNDPHNARDPRFRPELLMKPTGDGGIFDITLSI